MRWLRTGIVLAIVSLSLSVAAPAMADPPSTNPNVNPFTFTCVRGSETLTFQATGIAQSAQVVGQLSGGSAVIVFTSLVIDGQLIFDVPGQAERSDLWSCTIAEDPGVLIEAFLTPRR